MIVATDLNKRYGNVQAVKNISLRIDAGEVVGFLGANGAGKSTTMKLLAGVVTPDEGDICIFGNSLGTNPLACKQKMGFLPEDNPLYTSMYVWEYLEYAASFYLPQNQIKDAVDNAIELCGLKTEYRKRIEVLSRGNRQRVGLAQAIVHHPPFLMLDEPTAGLDPHQQEALLQFITDYGKENAVLFSTHHLSEVESVGTRAIVIHNGTITTDTPLGKEMPNIRELFNTRQ